MVREVGGGGDVFFLVSCDLHCPPSFTFLHYMRGSGPAFHTTRRHAHTGFGRQKKDKKTRQWLPSLSSPLLHTFSFAIDAPHLSLNSAAVSAVRANTERCSLIGRRPSGAYISSAHIRVFVTSRGALNHASPRTAGILLSTSLPCASRAFLPSLLDPLPLCPNNLLPAISAACGGAKGEKRSGVLLCF